MRFGEVTSSARISSTECAAGLVEKILGASDSLSIISQTNKVHSQKSLFSSVFPQHLFFLQYPEYFIYYKRGAYQQTGERRSINR